MTDASDETGPVWRRADGTPLTELELRIYERAGLLPAEAVEWANEGFEPYATENLRGAGADLPLALHLRALGLSGQHLRFAREVGDSLEAVAALAELGRSPGLKWPIVERLRRLGLAPDDIRAVAATGAAEMVIQLLEAGVPLRTVLDWWKRGLDLRACETALANGATIADMETELRWRRAFRSRAAALAWRSTGLEAEAAETLANRGYRPLDVLDGRAERGDPPAERPQAVLDPSVARPVTPGGGPLHPIVLDALGEGPAPQVLKAFGYAVVEVTPRSKFLALHATDLLITFGPEGVEVGTAAVEWTEGRALLHVLLPGAPEAEATTHPDAERALSALAADLERNGLRVKAISSTSLATAELLRLAQPLARVAGTLATLNGLDVTATLVDEAWWLLPSSPRRWPGYARGKDGATHAVGDLFLVETVRLSPVGFFANRRQGWAASERLVPVLLVERTDGAGHTATTRLLRDDAGLELLDEDGRARRLDTDDPVDAIAQTPSLCEIRANQATAFFATDETLRSSRLVPLLRLRQTTRLAEEAPIEFPSDYADAARLGSRAVSGLSQRRILVNGERWLATVPLPRLPARLVCQDPSEDAEMLPAFQEHWASFELSRGDPPYVFGEIGLVDKGVVGELVVDRAGESDGTFVLRGRGRSSRERQIASWLAKCFVSEQCSSLMFLLAELSILRGVRLYFPNSVNEWDADGVFSLELHASGEIDRVLCELRREGEEVARKE